MRVSAWTRVGPLHSQDGIDAGATIQAVPNQERTVGELNETMQHLEPEMLPTVVLVVAEGPKPLETVHIKEVGFPLLLIWRTFLLERWDGRMAEAKLC